MLQLGNLLTVVLARIDQKKFYQAELKLKLRIVRKVYGIGLKFIHVYVIASEINPFRLNLIVY